MKNIFKYILSYFHDMEEIIDDNNNLPNSNEAPTEEVNINKKAIPIKYYFIAGAVATIVLICYPDHGINVATPYIIRLLNHFFNDDGAGDDSSMDDSPSPTNSEAKDLHNTSNKEDKNSSVIESEDKPIERGRGRRAYRISDEEITAQINRRKHNLLNPLFVNTNDLPQFMNEVTPVTLGEDSPTTPKGDTTPKAMVQSKKTGSYF